MELIDVVLLENSTKAIVMHKMGRGLTLQTYIDKHGHFEPKHARLLFRQLLDGVQHCYDSGVVHR